MCFGHGPFSYIDMGGMFTILKVREGITTYEDPGWYTHPTGTVAGPATPEEIAASGLEITPQPTAEPKNSAGEHHHHH